MAEQADALARDRKRNTVFDEQKRNPYSRAANQHTSPNPSSSYDTTVLEHVLTMLQNINAKTQNTGNNANSNIFPNPHSPANRTPRQAAPTMAFKVCRHQAPISFHHPSDSSNQQVDYRFSPTVGTSVLRLLLNKILMHCIAAGESSTIWHRCTKLHP